MPNTRWPRIAAALLAIIALFAVSTRRADANGVPIRIPLSYLPNLSNWGPQDARGEAELSFSEGALKLEARGMLSLKGEIYQIWLAKSGTNRAVSLATLPGTPDGIAGYTGKLPALDGYDWDLLLITVEPQPDPNPAPAEKRFIGGFFTQYKRQDAAGAPETDTRPGQLPKTGEAMPAAASSDDRHKAAMMLFGVGGISLFLSIRRANRRRRATSNED